MEFIYDDGGRAIAGFKGNADDCTVRAIAIASGKPYREVYDELFDAGREFAENKRCKSARHARRHGVSPRNGVYKKVMYKYLADLGWKWNPTMFIGQGCKVHLTPTELPTGRLIVSVSKHTTCVIDGVLHDTYDCTRQGTRCVYGFWTQ